MSSRSIVPLRPYAVLVTAGLLLSLLVKFFVAASDVWIIRVFGHLDDNPLFYPTADSFQREITRLDRLVHFAGLADIALFVYTAVVFMIFFRHAYRNIMQPVIANRRYSPGWTIGAFLIPLVNLVLPYLVMREVCACSRTLVRANPDGHWEEERRPWLLRLWWPFTIAAFFVMDFGRRLSQMTLEYGALVFSTWIHLVGIVLYIVAATLALLLVWKLVDMQWRMRVNFQRVERLGNVGRVRAGR